jgi:hypothetical protein
MRWQKDDAARTTLARALGDPSLLEVKNSGQYQTAKFLTGKDKERQSLRLKCLELHSVIRHTQCLVPPGKKLKNMPWIGLKSVFESDASFGDEVVKFEEANSLLEQFYSTLERWGFTLR